MALEDILTAIKKETQAKILDLQKKEKLEIEKIKKEYQEKILKEMKRIQEESRVEQEYLLQQAQFQARLISKKKILEIKHQLIATIFNQGLKRLRLLSEKEYQGLIKKLFTKIPKLQNRVMVIPVKGREKITSKVLKELKLDYQLSKKSQDVTGGFTISSQDQDIDCTFEALLDDKKNEFEKKLAKILFD